MDVTKSDISNKSAASKGGTMDGRRRRALARLGLVSAGAYVAPTLLALRSTAVAPLPVVAVGEAA